MTALVISIDSASAVPPYEQIRLQFQRQITDGALLVGAKLPTVRHLATDLGLAVNTVARAYKELESDGFVQTRGRAGTLVASSADETKNRAEAAAIDYAGQMIRLGITPNVALELVANALREA